MYIHHCLSLFHIIYFFSEDLVQEVTEAEAEVTEQKENLDDSTAKKIGKFKWEAAIIGVLKRAEDNTTSIKRLRKKVSVELLQMNKV